MKRRAVLLGAIALSAGLLAGCGGSPSYQEQVENGYGLDTGTKVTVIQLGPDWLDVATFCDHGNRVYVGGTADVTVVAGDESCDTTS